MPQALHLLSLSTAVPPYALSQEDVAARARALFASRSADIDRLMPVFANAGIGTRYSCVPLDWYLTPSDWKSRNDLFIENAVALLQQAADKCLAEAGVAAAEVDTVVTVSTTGVATPSLDARLMQAMALRSDVERLPVFGLGCAGGVLGLARAGALAKARPGSKVLCLVVELCALTFRAQDLSKSNIVAAALFGDGAAAALLTCGDANGQSLPQIAGWGEHTWPDSLEVMGWRVENDGLGVLFSRDIPQIVRAQYGAALDRYLTNEGLTRKDIAGYICHPGGAKVIEALEDTLDLAPGSMAEARQVLRDYGNMSAATVLFVLAEKLAQWRGAAASAPEHHLLSALGPGFTAAFLSLLRPRTGP